MPSRTGITGPADSTPTAAPPTPPLELAPVAVFASFSGAGGVERMLVNLMACCIDLGRPVTLLTVKTDSPHLKALPAAVHRVDLGRRHALTATPALARYLRRHRPAVLLAAKDRAGRAAVLARRLAGVDTAIALRLGTNLSAALAGSGRLRRWLRLLPIRLLYGQLDAIIAVSEGVAEDAARTSGYPRARIEVICNPVVTPALTTGAARPPQHFWLKDGKPRALPVIVAAGRLERQKDFPTLLRAFAQLRRHRPARLLILGDGGGRAGLEALARKLGISDHLDLPGHVSDPHPLFAAADLFVLSSAWEGSPNVLTEALALGTPVVSTDCPSGPAEVLDRGRFGHLVPVGDAEALGRAMAMTLQAPLPAATLKAAVTDYDCRLSARRYLGLLDRAAAARRRRTATG